MIDVEKLEMAASCAFTLTTYEGSEHRDVCLEYTEHSTDHWHSNSETSIDLDEEKARAIVAFLCKAFPGISAHGMQDVTPKRVNAVIDRSDAVNLARNMLEIRNCKGITSHGVQVLCEAVMAMDAAIAAPQPAPPRGQELGVCECKLKADECDGQVAVFHPFQVGASCSTRPCEKVRAEQPAQRKELAQEQVAMKVGGFYNWKNQPERLVYLGRNWSGNGYWHQFAKVDSPTKVWCEVLTEDLNSFEETQSNQGG